MRGMGLGLGFANQNVIALEGSRGRGSKYRPQKSMFRYTASQVGPSYQLGMPLWTERKNEQKAAPAYTDYIER